MRKLMVVVVTFGVTLGAWAEEYTLEAGRAETHPTGNYTYEKMTVAGDFTALSLTTTICANIVLDGGTITANGKTAFVGYNANSSASTTVSQDADGRYGRLYTRDGGILNPQSVTISAPTLPMVTDEDDCFDLIDMQGGRMQIRSISNKSGKTARIRISEANGTWVTSGWSASGRFASGSFVVVLSDGAIFHCSMATDHGSWNAAGAEVTTMGTGDVALLSNGIDSKGSDYPVYVRSGAYFNHDGRVLIGRGSMGNNRGHVTFTASDLIGPNVTGLFSYVYNSAGADVVVTFNANTTNAVRTVEFGTGPTLDGAGVLKIGAESGASKLTARAITADSTLTIEKIGANEMSIASALTIPNLTLSAGKTRFAADCTVGNLALNGGAFVINDDTTVCFDNGLSELTGKVEKGDGTSWTEGEHVICYFKGDDPDFSALTADVDFRNTYAFSAVSVEDGDYAGYKKLVLTVTSRVKTIRITESGEVDLKALMGDEALTKVWGVEIAAGVTATNTTALEGLGVEVTGGGRLAVATPSPEFTGGVYIGNAIVEILCAAENPLGTGPMIIQGIEDASGGTDTTAVSQLCFTLGDDTPCRLANDILIESADSVTISKKSYSCSQFLFTKPPAGTVDFDGDVVARGSVSFASDGAFIVTTVTAERIRFNGTVDIVGNLVSTMRCGIGFRNRLTATGSAYASGSATSPAAAIPYIYLYSDANSIKYLTTRINGSFVCEGTDVLGGSYLYYGDCRASSALMLKTFDQRLSYARTDNDAANKCGLISADASAGAVLTLTGTVAGVSAVCNYTPLQGKLSVVMDQCGEEACTQTFKGGTHTTTGSITVKKGTLVFADNTSRATTLDKVPAVTVEGGELKLTTATEAALASVTNLTISGGTFTLDGTGANAFGALSKAVASISGDGKLALADGLEANVKCLKVDGQFVDAGRYTGEGGPSGATVLPQLTGTGVLTVRKSGLGMCIILR